MKRNAIIYGRWAPEAQTGNASSVSEQIADCVGYAKERQWRITGVTIDVYENCPALHRIVVDSVSGTKPWDIILVHDFAQISADAHLFEFHRRILLVHGIIIHSFTEKFVSGAVASLADPIEAFIAQYQRELREDASRQHRRAIE